MSSNAPWRLLLAAGLALGLQAAQAQTAPKPAAKPASAPAPKAAEGRTLSLGGTGGTGGSGKLMTRDELRDCLKQQASLTQRRTEVEAARGPIDREKEDLVKEQQALKGEREKVDQARAAIADLNARYQAYGEKVKDWNDRATALKDQGGVKADRERSVLERERVDLQKQQAALDADRDKLGDGSVQKAVDAFNARAVALDQKVTAWNERNAQLADRARALNRDRETWVNDCADRRYREDDEIAIRAEGK